MTRKVGSRGTSLRRAAVSPPSPPNPITDSTTTVARSRRCRFGQLLIDGISIEPKAVREADPPGPERQRQPRR